MEDYKRLYEIYIKKSDEELKEIINSKNEYTKIAIEVARDILCNERKAVDLGHWNQPSIISQNVSRERSIISRNSSKVKDFLQLCGILVVMVLIYPLGVYFLWKNNRFDRLLKVIESVCCFFLWILVIGFTVGKINDILHVDESLKGNVEIIDSSGNVLFTTTDLESVKASIVKVSNKENCVVDIIFAKKAVERLKEVTQSKIGDVLAIYVDGECIASPVVWSCITDGRIQIVGFDSFLKAREIVDAIKNGSGDDEYQISKQSTFAQTEPITIMPIEQTATELTSELITEIPTEEPETESNEETPHRDGMYGISDKKLNSIVSKFNPQDVRNDVTGNWRICTIAENIQMVDYAVDYYKRKFRNDDEIHAIVNFDYNTTTSISLIADNILDVIVHEYVKGEEHDAKLLFGGILLKEYWVYLDNGDIEEIQ